MTSITVVLLQEPIFKVVEEPDDPFQLVSSLTTVTTEDSAECTHGPNPPLDRYE